MKIVTYARVSTVGQERKGQSLPNQERAFSEHLKRSGDVRLRAYQESASGKSIDGRADFSRMIRELPELKPDAILVDTLDRFTRSLLDGLKTLEQLRGHGAGLLPLDWRRSAPINVDDDRDWADVVDEFTGAERERRRIARRVKRSYEGRRERGATTVSNPRFGILKQGDRLVPDPERAWIVREPDQRILSGESRMRALMWFNNVAGERRSRSWIYAALKDELGGYAVAGVRSRETQQRLNAYLATLRKYGKSTQHGHALTGVVACGKCVDLGFDPRKCLMPCAWQKTNGYGALICKQKRHGDFYVSTHLIEPLFVEFLERWQAPDVLDNWEVEPQDSDDAVKADALQKQLASFERQEAQLKSRRDAAFDMATDPSRAIANQARKALLEVERDERSLGVHRQAIHSELARLSLPAARNKLDIAELLSEAPKLYWELTSTERNELARALCRTLGSNPRVYRVGKKSTTVEMGWPELKAFETQNSRTAACAAPAEVQASAHFGDRSRPGSRRSAIR